MLKIWIQSICKTRWSTDCEKKSTDGGLKISEAIFSNKFLLDKNVLSADTRINIVSWICYKWHPLKYIRLNFSTRTGERYVSLAMKISS